MHNTIDRGMIKWAPFNSVVNSKEIVNQILKEKSKITIPKISEEQKNNNEQNIINAYYENIKIKIEYFYAGRILKINDYIKKIDFTFNKIYFNNKIILFDQIINTTL